MKSNSNTIYNASYKLHSVLASSVILSIHNVHKLIILRRKIEISNLYQLASYMYLKVELKILFIEHDQY